MTSDGKVSDYLDGLAGELAEVGVILRDLLDTSLARAEGTLWHGHPVWMIGKTPIAGFKAYPKYVTVLVWRAAELAGGTAGLAVSPAGLGSLKLAAPGEVDEAALAAAFTAAEALA